LSGRRRKITILFTDIRQFTNLSEKMPPEHVVSILNEYFENMIDTIFKYQGTLDKFLGDGMMVEFGAPLEDSMQEMHGGAGRSRDATDPLCPQRAVALCGQARA
jgi:adenylate cyclase